MQFRIQSSHFALLKRKFMPAGMIHVSGKSYGRTQPLDVLKNLRRQAIFREKTSATSEMKKNRAAAHAVTKHPIEEPQPTTLTPT